MRTVPPALLAGGQPIKNPRAGTQFGASTAAAPGDSVALDAHVIGRPGAPQTVTISIGRGPGTAITVSAGARGGTVSTATIKSATGKPIALVLPHYLCFLPPTRTFCPALNSQIGAQRYTLSFAASAPQLIALAVHVKAA